MAPQLEGHTAFHTRVALNTLRIVERELERDCRGGADEAELDRPDQTVYDFESTDSYTATTSESGILSIRLRDEAAC